MAVDEKLLAKLSKHVDPARPKGYGVTVREFAEYNKVSTNYARQILDGIVKAGGLKVAVMRIGRGRGLVYHE